MVFGAGRFRNRRCIHVTLPWKMCFTVSISLMHRARTSLLVSARRSPSQRWPKIFLSHKELLITREKLTQHFRDVQDVEFTIEEGKLWMLQTRNEAGFAAVNIALDMVKERLIKKEEAILRIPLMTSGTFSLW